MVHCICYGIRFSLILGFVDVKNMHFTGGGIVIAVSYWRLKEGRKTSNNERATIIIDFHNHSSEKFKKPAQI